MTKIIDRTGKGSAINTAEFDANYSSLAGINETVTGITYTVTIDDQNRTLEFSNVSPIDVTMTAIATISAALHTDDFKVTLLNIGAGTVTATRGSTDTFLGGGTTLTLLQGEGVTLQTDSTLGIWNIVPSAGKNLLGITSSVAELNILDGVTSTAAELNILDGVTSTAAEINYLDIAALGTGAASKAVVLNGSSNYTTPSAGAWTWSAGSTANFAGTLQVGGVTVSSTAAELNYLDIVTLGTGAASKAVVLNGSSNYTTPSAGAWLFSGGSTVNIAGAFQVGGVSVTSSAAELNYLDITTLGTAQASKALTLDASSNLNGTVNSATITTLNSRAATPRRVLIESKSVSGATADFTTGIDSTYTVYEFEFIHVLPATDNTNFWCRFSTDGGSSYITTGSYNWAMSKTANAVDASNGQLADASIVLSLFNNNSATYDGTSGSMKLFNPSDANKKSIIGSFNHTHATTAYWTIENVSGELGSTTSAVNAIRFLFSSGNITSGIINLYGIS